MQKETRGADSRQRRKTLQQNVSGQHKTHKSQLSFRHTYVHIVQ